MSPNTTTSTATAGGASSPALLNAFTGVKVLPSNDTLAIMEALYLHGPLAVYMYAAMPDFMFYADGIYDNAACPSVGPR